MRRAAAALLLVSAAALPQAVTPGSSDLPGCGRHAWKHIYNPSRLLVINQCVIVTGTIADASHGRSKDGVRHEADGDTHGWLAVDGPFVWMLNDGNRSEEGGNLVFEVPCYFPVHQQDAVQACEGYHAPTSVPPIGTRVRITGSLVQDTNHGRWNEIHPVVMIERLR